EAADSAVLHDLGVGEGGGLEHAFGGDAELLDKTHLLPELPLGHERAGIGADAPLDPGLDGLQEALRLTVQYARGQVALAGGEALGARHDVVDDERRDDVGGVLQCRAYALLVHEAGVLDGPDTRLQAVQDGVGRVGVRGDVGASLPRRVHYRLELQQAQLSEFRVLAFVGHAAAGHDLDEVGAFLALLAHRSLHLVGAVGLAAPVADVA